MKQIRQLAWQVIVDLDAINGDRQLGHDRMDKFSPESVRLPLEIIALRDKRGQSTGTLGKLLQQRAVDLVANTNAKYPHTIRCTIDRRQQLSLFILSRHTVGQNNDIQRSVRVFVSNRSLQRRPQRRAASGPLRI